MTPPENTPISLQSLVMLNDEIVALARAGVPLDLGMRGMGTSGSIGRVADKLAMRLHSGQSLSQAIEAEKFTFPPIYQAVVQAGLKSGNLAESLESFAKLMKTNLELRRQVRLAFVYPIWVVFLAYGLFVAFVAIVAPQLIETEQSMGVGPAHQLEVLRFLSNSVTVWGPAVPLTLLGLWLIAVVLRMVTGTAGSLHSLMNWIPGVGGATRLIQMAHFADVLAILVRCETPLHAAMPLAAESTGNTSLTNACRSIAHALEQGNSLDDALFRFRFGGRLPSLLRWMMSAGSRDGQLASALVLAAEIFRRRVATRINWITALLPVACVVLIGGSATLLYSLTVFFPFTHMLNQLANLPY